MSIAYGRIALSAVLTLVASCAPLPATEVVIRVDSNIGPTLHAVHVVLDRGQDTVVLHDHVYEIGSTFTLPGTIAVVPRDASDVRPLRARVTADVGNPDRSFTTTVAVRFAAQRAVLLDVYLAADCQIEAVR